jgi:hypothetical protein
MLLQGPSSAVVSGSRFDHEGTFRIIDTSSMNGPGVYQVNLDSARGSFSVRLAFSDSPRKMLITS